MKSLQSSKYKRVGRVLIMALSVMGLFAVMLTTSGCGPDPSKEKPPAGYYEGPMKPKGGGPAPAGA